MRPRRTDPERSAAHRLIMNDARRYIEGQALALQLLIRRLEPSIEAGEWLIEPADVRAELEEAKKALPGA